MAKSLLEIIAENERARIEQKNLQSTDDVQSSPYRELANNEGLQTRIDYSNDVNFESLNVSDVGDRAFRDLVDLNINVQDNYERVDTTLNDASVIDMPSIGDISQQIYINNRKYNKFVTFDYIRYQFEDPNAFNEQIDDYGTFINEVKRDLESRGFTLADVFIGNFRQDDSPIGTIGAQALNVALNEQFNAIVKRETIGKINNQAFSVLQTGQLFRKDYDITVRKNPIARTAEFLTELQGFEFPFSYLPNSIFGFERNRFDNNGKISYVGSTRSLEERIYEQLQYTGRGQQQHLINLLKLNIYNPKIEGKFETLERDEYIPYVSQDLGSLDAKDFIVTFDKSIDTGRGTYEPYGVISTHKRTSIGKLFSDKFQWQWFEDVSNEEAIGWVDTGTSNRFNPDSLLYKTQERLNGMSRGGFGSFMDMSDKEFAEVVNGQTYVISRSDNTTASGNYIDDDGTPIERGEFFRVWTKARGYNRLSRTLRHRGLDNGDTRSVLNDNGLINFAPTLRRPNSQNGLQSDQVIKRYMFSIENLAWADNMDDLPLCEQGVGDPVTGTRGRIMWFPPYNLKITENSEMNLQSTELIGRSEPVFTYNSTTRSGSLSFSIIVDHPDIVNKLKGEKTEFWERYFKGDKLIENEARAIQALNQRLSQNEIDELQKRRNISQPIEKIVDQEVVTPESKDQEQKQQTNEQKDDGSLGELKLSVFFPNNETTIPTVPISFNLNDESNNFTVREDLSLADVQYQNMGYEDGGRIGDEGFTTIDGYIIESKSGIRYKKPGDTTSINGIYTYNNGKLIDDKFLCSTIPNPPKGYKDRTNFGFNQSFYYNWKENILSVLKGAKKARITIVGNASAANPPSGFNNNGLSKGRADAVEEWFNKNVVILLNNIGEEIELDIQKKFQGDLEDIQKKEQFEQLLDQGITPDGLGFCEDCNDADNRNCKLSRRTDIFIKVLEEDEPLEEPSDDEDIPSTIDEKEDEEDYTQDDDEAQQDPDQGDPLPALDPNILDKLVYTECDFFEYLEINDPIAYQTISERIKYFKPAYHSITPQGFNSRLTFLQQCLRQGDSIGRDGIDNWKNLAFGRMPVCILRIGDFYHTRILIESYNIDYNEEMNWDLNPEGIGVQPMYADITLNIKILGGSSMTAPINRLQNALSFNYFANTEMYDARADSVVFGDKNTIDEEGSIDDSQTFGTLKNGRIVDGIRLSSLVNHSESERVRNLANLRKQSRITLENSLDSPTPTEQISELGEVGTLLELKKSLGLALTRDEQIQQRSFEATNDKFESNVVSDQAKGEVKSSLTTSLTNQESLLYISTQELIERGEQTPDTLYASIFDQFINASVSNPDELTEEYKTQIQQEFIDSYQQVWLDFD